MTTREKRKRRRRNRNLRMVRPQNKFLQLELIQQRCREALEEALKLSNNDWNNLQWPQGWNYDKYIATRNYCNEQLRKHRDGRMARIMGGQKQTELFNAWLWEAVELIGEARKQGLMPDDIQEP